MRRRSLSYVLGAAMAAALLTVGVAACGGGGGGGGGKEGGTIKIVGESFPDYLDPGLSYTVEGWEPLYQVYPGLLTYPHVSGQAGAAVKPGLAKELPKVSSDNKTYDFQLRDNLQFSDGTPIKATDFKKSIERQLAQDGQGSSFWTGLAPIEGAAEFLKTKKGGITGITADDATGKITIKLTEPSGVLLYELATPFGGIVPGDTPAKNMTKDPPPGAGRYVIKDVNQGRSYSLVRNKNFSKSLEGTDVDAGKADGFQTTIGSASQNATKVSQNQADFTIDNPATDRLPEIRQKYKDRYGEFATNSVYYFFTNTEAPPFDKLEVRQAVNYAIDKKATSRIYGGLLEPAHNVLGPLTPGYDANNPDLYKGPNVPKAKQLIEKAGAKGAKVTVWGDDDSTSKAVTEYLTDVLNSIGLDAKTKILNADTYFATVGDRSLKAQIGFTDWFQDYPHPADFIDILFNPDNVVATGNNNFEYNASDKELAKQINDASAQPELTNSVKSQWSALDREIQKKAYGVMYGNQKQATFFSDRMDFENCKGQHATYTHDWAEFCLK